MLRVMWRATQHQLQLVRSARRANALTAFAASSRLDALRSHSVEATDAQSSLSPSCIETALLALADPERARRRTGFFKSAYSRDDTFLGVTKPECRAVVRAHIRTTTRAEVSALLHDRRHDLRIAGGICLVETFTSPLKYGQWLHGSDDGSDSGSDSSSNEVNAAAVSASASAAPLTALELKQQVVDMYLAHLAHFDNWDLVDLTSYKILGAWLVQHAPYAASVEQFCMLVDDDTADAAATDDDAVNVANEMTQLESAMRVLPPWYQSLLVSNDFWETRVSIVLVYGVRTTNVAFALHIVRYHLLRLLDRDSYALYIKGQRFDDTDLVHKACGWMLRECGRANRTALLQFLDRYASLTPSTSLQYATEHLAPDVAKAIRARGRRADRKQRRTKSVAAAAAAVDGVRADVEEHETC